MHVGRRNDLVTAVRTAAVAAIRAGAMTAAKAVKRLRERKLAIFDRLALYILAQFPAETVELIAIELLSDLDRLRDEFDHREFGMVVAAGFPHLSAHDQRRVVELIDAGPDVGAFRERAEGRGFVISDAHVTRHVLQWRTQFTEVILEHAPEDLRARYRQWKEELAKVAASLEPAPATRTREQLREMPPAEVIEYFRTISLSQRHERTRFDLGHELQQVVAGAAEEFSRIAEEMRDLEPSLIHWFIYDISQAVQQKREIDWSSVVALLEFVIAQPLEPTRVFENSWAAVRRGDSLHARAGADRRRTGCSSRAGNAVVDGTGEAPRAGSR